MPIEEVFLFQVCCDGRARIRTWERSPLKLHWADREGGNTGELNLSDYPIEQHPFTWTTHSQPRPGYKPYNVWIQAASGPQTWSPDDYPLGTRDRALSPSSCDRISRVNMRGIIAYYEFDVDTYSWSRPAGVSGVGGRGGNFTVTYYNSTGNIIGITQYDGNTARGLYKVKVEPFQDTESPLTCPTGTFCTLDIYNAQGDLVRSVTFPDGEGCPNVWQTGCTSLEPPQETFFQLDSYYDFAVLPDGTSTRTQWTDCIIVYGVTREGDSAQGLRFVKKRLFSLQTIFPNVPYWDRYGNLRYRTVIDLDEWSEEEEIGYKWSPIGCPPPAYTVECDPEPDEPRCPDGTVYECVREDGKTCCYDCEGNVITVID